MVVAAPYLNGEINAHFGSTQAFLIAETSDGKMTRTAVYEVQGMQHNHSGIAGFLKEQGVQVILAGGMGAPMQQALKQQGFDLFCGVAGPALQAIEALPARGDRALRVHLWPPPRRTSTLELDTIAHPGGRAG